jgi:site-specific DNA-methyltransferase (adenine-specific)
MKIESKLLKNLNPASYNPRQISSKQYKDLKESIKKFGLVDPIIVNKDNTVIGGHQRLKVCKELKYVEVECVMLDLSKEEERELNIRLNKNTGDFDMDILANEFDIEELTDWGFKHIDLDINIDKITEGNTEDDHIPEVKESRVKLGDVWQLGKHRLMCGDNMDLMKQYEDNYFDLAIIDPPYGINFDGETTVKGKGGKAKTFSNKQNHLKKDWDNETPKKEYFDELIRISKNQIIWGGNYFTDKLPVSRGWIYWDKKITNKNNKNFSDGELAYTSFDKRLIKFTYDWIGFGYLNNPDKEKKIHPTQKPVQIYKWLLEEYAEKDFKIIDTHLGSGSSLIASIKHKIKEFVGMELDNDYCDKTLERWEQFTGQKAKKV